MGGDLLQRLFGGAHADLGLRAGAEAAGHAGAELDRARRAGIGQRLRVCVGGDKVDALERLLDHVVDGIPAGAADSEYRDASTELVLVGVHQIDCHLLSLFALFLLFCLSLSGFPDVSGYRFSLY